MTMTESTKRNGVDTEALFATINVVNGQPELAASTFRAANTWIDGTTAAVGHAGRRIGPEVARHGAGRMLRGW